MKDRIGFMQGRLSPMINGKIQAFPWEHWESEFQVAHSIGITKMEWTLDQQDLYKNPLMNEAGQARIKQLSRQYNLSIPSLTGDCFMQAPFYKDAENQDKLLLDFDNIIKACGKLGIGQIIFPLVDNGALKTEAEEEILLRELKSRVKLLNDNKVQIVFESDFAPRELKQFISKLPVEFFGVNYDIGNSASLGFNPAEEIPAYGDRVYNVHVKDRVLGGTTVPLGTGNANFEVVFDELRKIDYSGNFILQTARSQTNEHAEFVTRFSNFVQNRLEKWI